MSVGVDEHARVAAPEGGRARPADRRAGGLGLREHGVDLLGRTHVVGERDAAEAAAVDDAGVEQRVSLVTLGVSDLSRAREFYEGLGWTTGAAPADDVVFFQAGGMIVALWSRAQLAEDTVVTDNGGWGGVTLAYNTRSPAEVDSVLEEARAAGGTVLRAGAETFWGGYSGVFADPDGHPWEVAHNPHWTIGEDGSVTLS